MLSFSLAAVAAASLASASPVFKRQGLGSGLPPNATIVDASNSTNITYTPIEVTTNGTNLNVPVFTSVPQGVNETSWANYTNATEPYPGASIFIGNPTTNGTNTTMAWVGQPAGGLLRYKPTCVFFSFFSFSFLSPSCTRSVLPPSPSAILSQSTSPIYSHPTLPLAPAPFRSPSSFLVLFDLAQSY
jgi:hypothetical protein